VVFATLFSLSLYGTLIDLEPASLKLMAVVGTILFAVLTTVGVGTTVVFCCDACDNSTRRSPSISSQFSGSDDSPEIVNDGYGL
jgi:hypothetical protein